MATPTINTDCLQFITIPPGGTGAVPNGAQVLYYEENGILTSGCESVQAQIDDVDTSTVCQVIAWNMEDDSGGGTGPWSYGDIRIAKFGLGGTVYNVNFIPLNSPSTQDALVSEIQSKFPFIIAKFHSQDDAGERDAQRLILKIPTIFSADFFLEFDWHTPSPNFSPARIYATLCESGECCDSSSE